MEIGKRDRDRQSRIDNKSRQTDRETDSDRQSRIDGENRQTDRQTDRQRNR